MKVVINDCFGGFSLSRKAVLRAREISGDPKWGGSTIAGDIYKDGGICTRDYGFLNDEDRTDKVLVQVVEELGEEANGSCAALKVIEIPDGIQYTIEGYDGLEEIAEVHRTWR